MSKALIKILAALAVSTFSLSTALAVDSERKKKPRVIDVKKLKEAPEAHFCANIKDSAREQRYAIKTKELNELRAAVEMRIKALEKKRAEFEAWQTKRDEFAARAEGSLVEIYSKMRPDAAAGRLELLDVVLAAAILLKIPPRKAGVILNEMKPKKAAGITQVIAASGSTEKRS